MTPPVSLTADLATLGVILDGDLASHLTDGERLRLAGVALAIVRKRAAAGVYTAPPRRLFDPAIVRFPGLYPRVREV